MTISAAKMKATRKYRKKVYDRIEIQTKTGTRERYKTEADKRGISLTQFIVDCVEKEIKASRSDYLDKLLEVTDDEAGTAPKKPATNSHGQVWTEENIIPYKNLFKTSK